MKYVHRKGPSLYYVRDNKWTWLCPADASEADIHGAIWKILTKGRDTIAEIADSYLEHKLPKLALRTQESYELIVNRRIKPVFGHMRPDEVTSRDVAMYLEKREQSGHGATGNREMAVLSSVMNHGMRMGKVNINPCYGVRRNEERPRTYYIENESLRLALRHSKVGLRHLIWVAYLTGLRQRDLLTMTRDQITPEGLRVTQSKDGKRVVIVWSESLRKVVRRAAERSGCNNVFTNDRGEKYTKSGVQSAMRRLKARTGIDWRFHDLRAKAESDHESGLGLMTRYNRARRLKAVR
jgi:integrase